MANTYSKIYLHGVFAVRYREALIPYSIQEDLYSYLGGVITRKGHTPIIIGGMPDHMHFLFGFSLDDKAVSIPSLVKSLKLSSRNFLNRRVTYRREFYWQEGYGMFSVSPTHRQLVTDYIMNQRSHHGGQTFLNEYERLLQRNEVEYDKLYIFQELE